MGEGRLKIQLVKHLGGLRPVDDIGTQALSRLKQGDVVMVEYSRPRNPRHHRLFFALLNIVANNSPHYDDPEQVLLALKIATGHVVPHIAFDGKTYMVPQSIAFNKMDQDAFDRFFDKCVDIVVRRFLPGVTDAELRAELESMTQGRAA
jgi:hypothetical protein